MKVTFFTYSTTIHTTQRDVLCILKNPHSTISIYHKTPSATIDYFFEDGLFFPLQSLPNRMSHPITIETALAGGKINITTHVVPKDETKFTISNSFEVIDWSKTIDALERAGKVTTQRVGSMMALDAREFCFVGDAESTFYGVDCLGTTLCQDISERVKGMWELEFA